MNEIPKRYKGITLDAAEQTDIILRMKEFREKEKGACLIISGCNGCGKTFAMWALIQDFEREPDGIITGDYPGCYNRNPKKRWPKVISPNWFKSLEICSFPEKHEKVQTAQTADWLFIDDMGAEDETAQNIGVMEILIDERYQHERTTVILTDKHPNAFRERYSRRIISRLKDWGCLEQALFESAQTSFRERK